VKLDKKGESKTMSKETATKAITVRVSEKEYKALKDIAKKTGQSLSCTVRHVIHYDIIKYAQKNNALKVLMNYNDVCIKKKKKK
jgi:predicted DNA-binding protein